MSPVIPDPSLSRATVVVHQLPNLFHALHQEHSSVLSLAADDRNIYAGSQDGQISVWDKYTFKLRAVLSGHTGSVLALEYAPQNHWLFSASGDSTIRVWSTRSLYPLHILHPHLDTDSGDLFSLVWSPESHTLYFGCQNTSLQWFPFPLTTPQLLSASPSLSFGARSSSGASTPPSRKAHKFFDSYPQYTRRPADLNARNPTCASRAISTTPPSASSLELGTSPDPCVQSDAVQPLLSVFQVPPENVIYSAHYGYVYCIALLPSHRDGSDDLTFEMDQGKSLQLVTGSGDSTVKLWQLPDKSSKGAPQLLHTFDCGVGAVLSLVVRGDTIFAGCQDGLVKVWDLETRTLVRTLLVVELGADASLLPTGDSTNPLVMATFRGSQTSARKPRILFYGHYDVISARSTGWVSDPFTLSGRNGYLYGRGATDNKGPVMAVACAAAELLAHRALGVDLVLLVEGEEEAGSGGFVETVKRHKETIGPIDSILVSNSTWIAEDTPCITYGLRGVVHCNVEIFNAGPDLHSGVDGGAAREPMLDM
ncbi:hypothetical protein GSI_15008 [Ganoderma sinense ZZ0214-1]|uniref:Uncharacterized protein n=1 Tax=Ganoderma sinense ZZ0214-1 TaxID=1077348 RepID=A0A2G8RLD0_9APHY|nr:hypothetical protein GSI_15008 [Ganoderma sinense ZZ0214-1]